jgi:hypothetical protein
LIDLIGVVDWLSWHMMSAGGAWLLRSYHNSTYSSGKR